MGKHTSGRPSPTEQAPQAQATRWGEKEGHSASAEKDSIWNRSHVELESVQYFQCLPKKHFIVKVTFKMKKMTDVKIDSFFCRCQKVLIRTKITFPETFLTLFYFLPKKLVWRSRWRNFCKLFLKPKILVIALKLEKLNWGCIELTSFGFPLINCCSFKLFWTVLMTSGRVICLGKAKRYKRRYSSRDK